MASKEAVIGTHLPHAGNFLAGDLAGTACLHPPPPPGRYLLRLETRFFPGEIPASENLAGISASDGARQPRRFSTVAEGGRWGGFGFGDLWFSRIDWLKKMIVVLGRRLKVGFDVLFFSLIDSEASELSNGDERSGTAGSEIRLGGCSELPFGLGAGLGRAAPSYG